MPSPKSEAKKAKEEAQKVLEDAKRHKECGDDAGARRMIKVSLGLCELPEARELSEWLDKFGAGSEFATAVERVMSARDHYEIVGLPRFSLADEKDVHRRYLKMTRTLHPDKNKSRDAEAAFQSLTEAVRVLRDEEARAKYDAKLQAQAQAPPKAAPPARGRSQPPPQPRQPPPQPQQAPPPQPQKQREPPPDWVISEAVSLVNGLKNDALKSLCRRRGLQVAGSKDALRCAARLPNPLAL